MRARVRRVRQRGTDSEFSDATGVAVLAWQPVGVAAVVSVEDDDGRTGEASSPGFAAGLNRLTVTVR